MQAAIEAMTPAEWEEVREIYQEGIASNQATFEVEARTQAWMAPAPITTVLERRGVVI